MLTKLGVGQKTALHLWDHDKVESHNPANQAYNPADVGVPKVTALRRHIENWSCLSTKVLTHEVEVREKVAFEGVVFLCLDNMKARKDICESSVFHNDAIKLCVETRMDATFAQAIIFDPNNDKHIDQWRELWFDDGQADNTFGCGSHMSVITAVETSAMLAVQSFIRWAKNRSFDGVNNLLALNLLSWKMQVVNWAELD